MILTSYKDSTHPYIHSTGVWDVVMDVTVITQTDNGETDQGTHVEGKDRNE